ncbi:MAG: hypothetical protein HN738_10200 [Gammaproteobacteria bacterium]|jgi:hypothetical protein|nr:hypothetical protein [Gammaproteobacteria bacterium]
MNHIHPIVYEKKIKEADRVLAATFKPKTPRERALVIQIEKAAQILRG